MRYLLLILLFTGCFTENRARKQFSKSVVAFPKIGADYCADEFPIKDSTITDTLLTTDTIFIQGAIIEDTVTINDTVRITIIKTLPAKIITNTVHIRDTIIKTNTAEVAACKIDNSKLTDLLVKKTSEADKYKGQAKKRGITMWSLIGLIVAYIALRIYIKSKI